MTESNDQRKWMPGSTVIRPWLTVGLLVVGVLLATVAAPLVVSVWNSPSSGGRSKGLVLATMIVVPLGLLVFGLIKATWDWRLHLISRAFPTALVSTVVRSRDTEARIGAIAGPAAAPISLKAGRVA